MSGQFSPEILQQILSMIQSQNSDPFQRPLPGEGLLGAGRMSQPSSGFNQELPMGAPMSAMPNEVQTAQNATATIPTDFANTQPGLPNLPDTFTGFGFGQFAPKEFQPKGIRGQLIEQLMKHLGSSGGMNNEMKGGMMAGGGMQHSLNGGFQ